MRVTKIAVGAGVVVLGLVCWLAVASRASELLIAIAALVVLVGGGNFLAGRRGPPAGRPQPSAEQRATAGPGDQDVGP